MSLIYISLFAGIEAFTVAVRNLGWICKAVAQYEPGDNVQFPSKVLEYHYPDIPNLGDVTKITEEQVAALGHIDLIVGGSPCQDLSLAGKRSGLRDENGNITRSGLFDYQMQIFEWARKRCGCRFLLWENVPGALSSGKDAGADFAYILGSMVKRDVSVPPDGWKTGGICTSDDWSRIVEWRVLDAQFFRETPQRRRRIFALCDTGAWWSRPPILLEPESMFGDSQESEGTQQDSPGNTGEDIEGDGRRDTYGWNARDIRGSKPTKDSMDPLGATQYKGAPLVGYPTVVSIQTGHTTSNGCGINTDDTHFTLSCANDTAVAYQIDSVASNSMKSSNPHSGFHKEDKFCTLDTSDQNPMKNQGGMVIMEKKELCNPPTASGNDVFPTLTSIQSSKIWLGNQEAFSGDFWIVEHGDKSNAR